MKKYSTKKHLSLDIAKNETWIKNNHKMNFTYRNVDANWKKKLDLLTKQEKEKLIFKFAYEANKKLIKAILQSGGEEADLNAFDKDGNNALMYAVKSGDKDVVKFLIEEGIRSNYVNNMGFSPIHLAVRKNNIKLVATIVDNGGSMRIKDKDGQEPIFDAVYENNSKMIACLILNGLYVDTINIKKETPLMISAKDGKRQEAMLTLLRHNANVDAVDYLGKNAFMHAIENDNNPLMDILLKWGTNLNAKDFAGNTPLMYCAKTGNREGIRVLIARGANIFEKNNNGETALDIAKQNGFQGSYEILAKAERILLSEQSAEQKSEDLKQFAKHNKVENSCAR